MLTILIAVDGSEHSERTVRQLIDLGRHVNELRVRLLNVQPEPLNWEYHHGVIEDEAVVRQKELGKRMLEKEGMLLEAAGVPFEWSVELGDPAETIVRVASEYGCNMIGVGSHGLGAVAGLLLGSVATKVIRSSRLPVLLIK
jgi:nucleotide-binding universal stress UspA family protein